MVQIVILLLIANLCVRVSSDDDCILKAIEALSGKHPNNDTTTTSTTVETSKTTITPTDNGDNDSSLQALRRFETLYVNLKSHYEKKLQNLQKENEFLKNKMESTSSNLNSIHTIQTFCTCNVTDHRISDNDCSNSKTNIILEKVHEIHEKLANISGNISFPQSNGTENQDFNKIKRIRRTHRKYVGCYRDNHSHHRGLRGFAASNVATTVDSCVAICRSGNYVYAGLQAGSWCFCGNSMQHPVMNYKLSDGNCNFPCSGNNTQICGAGGMNSIYETGVEQYLIDEEGQQLTDSYLAPVANQYYILNVNCG